MNVCENIIDEFPIKIKKAKVVTIPETKNLFKVDRSKPLNNNKAGLFHTTDVRGLLLCKRDRQDIQPTIAILCPIVKQLN